MAPQLEFKAPLLTLPSVANGQAAPRWAPGNPRVSTLACQKEKDKATGGGRGGVGGVEGETLQPPAVLLPRT